jgi:hypothetical protein
MIRTVGALSLVAILGGGVAVGVVLDRHWLRPRAERQVQVKAPRPGDPGHLDHQVARFRERLKLDAGQEKVVREALRDMNQEVAALRKRIAPEMRTVRARARERVEAVLTAAQKARYAEMIKEWEARRARRGY